jgi:acyl-coenzyme A thioesterase PaaI-like protein
MTAQLLEPARTGEVVVVTARALGRDGRKVRVSTALRTPAGALLAAASATWIVPRSPEPEGPRR